MRVYTFERGKEVFEFYDIRQVKKKSLELSKEFGEDILVTCMHKPSYKQDWYTATPTGEFLTNLIGFKANN